MTSEPANVLPVSKEWLEQKLQTIFGITNTLTSIQYATPPDGQNYLSFIARLQLEWLPPTFPDGKETVRSLFFKIPSSKKLEAEVTRNNDGGLLEDDFMLLMHKNECNFYNLFRETDPDLVALTPMCFFNQLGDADAGEPGIVVLEDLSGRGKVPDILDGLNLQQLLETAKAIGKVHAWSVQNQGWKANVKCFFDAERDGGQWTEIMKHAVSSLKQQYPTRVTLPDDVAKQTAMLPWKLQTEERRKTGERTTVMIHADLWISNLLFGCTPETSDQLIGIIDWQNIHASLGPVDLTRLLCSSCTSTIRRQHTKEILQAYYESFSRKLRPDRRSDFPKDEVQRWYDEQLVTGAWGMVFGLSVFLPTLAKRASAEQLEELVTRAMTALEDGYAYLKSRNLIPLV